MKLWRSFNFNADHNFNGINGAGEAESAGGTVRLVGAECLVFFLVGMIPPPPEAETTTNENDGVPRDGVPRGFSRNPANPFKIDNGKRIGPFIDFIEGGFEQLKHPNAVVAQAVVFVDESIEPAEGYREYVGEYVYWDSYQGQEEPIWYVSAYGGNRYDELELPDSMQASNGGNGVYRQGKTASSPPWNKDSYQLISPGKDTQYGTGGFYRSGETDDLHQTDKDNITNFAARLK